jgi:hypothetical protein
MRIVIITVIGSLLLAACGAAGGNGSPPRRYEMFKDECEARGGYFVSLRSRPDLCLRRDVVIEP